MNRVRTVDDFVLRLRRIGGDYRNDFGPLIARVRHELAGKDDEILTAADAALEFHARQYVVNSLLAALNWRMNLTADEGLPNLLPEVPVTSSETGRILFLDYFGREITTSEPLLIVETKRPSSGLPRIADPAELVPGRYATQEELRRYLARVVSRGLQGEQLREDWSDWLSKLREYVRSVCKRASRAPRRVVVTNGDWLIIFLDPEDAFLGTHDTPDPDRIVVFENYEVLVEDEAGALLRHLEYWAVSDRPLSIRASEVVFYLTGDQVDRAMHGIRLRYSQEPRNYGDPPAIWVAPVLFLRSNSGSWLLIDEPPTEYRIPERYRDLKKHLTAVQAAAKGLLGQVATALNSCPRLSSLSEHYDDKPSFAGLRGVTEEAPDRYIVATGRETHYLLPTPSVPNCPYHDWLLSNKESVASSHLVERSTSPRAYFVSGELHHCSHRDVESAKWNRITDANSSRCGSRSGSDGQAFCEIWRYETHLCCRTCVFEDVCTKAEVFRLPCQRKSAQA